MPSSRITTRRSEFTHGVKDTFPMILGAIPFGIIFGAYANQAGLSTGAIMGMSLFVFAGSSQFIGAGLVAQHADLLVIVLTTLVVNLRHALYSASLGPYMKHLPQRWLAPLAFWLTDETYAVVIRRYTSTDTSPYTHWYHLGSSLFMYINWNICTLIGVVAGQRLSGINDLGLEFAMVVTFTGIVIPLLVTRPMLVCALVAAITSVLTNPVPHKLGLIITALAGIGAGLVTEALHSPSTQPDNTHE